ncbi:MAG: phage integrase N-terminal SAM-like domain-containing protein, partial [Cyclobacteriaceae bacterium]
MVTTFKAFLEGQGKSKGTVKHYHSYIIDFLGWLDKDNTEAENATAKEVLSYLNELQKRGQENQTRSIRLSVIKQFFSWQIDQGQRADNPIQHLKIRGIKKQKLYPILDKQQLESLYNEYPIPTETDEQSNRNWFTTYKLSRQRNKTIINLLIHQGLTTPEIERLTMNDLKLKEGSIYITGSRMSNERTLELKSSQIMELMEYTYQVRKELLSYQADKSTEQLFLPVPPAGRSQSYPNTLSIWKGITRELKEQQRCFINFRQVRTSVITHWLKQYNLREVQQMAGHRYVS